MYRRKELLYPGLFSEVIRRKGSVDVETAPNSKYLSSPLTSTPLFLLADAD